MTVRINDNRTALAMSSDDADRIFQEIAEITIAATAAAAEADKRLADIKAQGIQAIVVTEKLNKKAVEKAISDGKTITGAEIRTGEIVKYDVRRELLDRTTK